ncbi:MAG: hypothetical protein KY444_06865 [Gemmatimonadetes bacterium]|nr:hypothetical protein [Gemmatimonadota bacterium]
MKLRFRVLAALLALFALSLTWVQAGWASTCAPGAESTAEASAEAGGAASDCATDMGMSHSDDPRSGHGEPDAPACPFGPMTASGCVAPSLPAHTPVAVAPSPEGAVLVGSADSTRDRLLSSAFFRPPRA